MRVLRESGTGSRLLGLSNKSLMPGQDCVAGGTTVHSFFILKAEQLRDAGFDVAGCEVHLWSRVPDLRVQEPPVWEAEQRPPSPSLRAEAAALAASGKCSAALARLEEGQRLSGF